VVKEVAKKCGFLLQKILPKVNTHQIVENSPNLVTLFVSRKMKKTAFKLIL
jgi:hypothetical protein